MSPFTPKDWRNYPDTATPITAEALEDLETRLAGYTDSASGAATPADGSVTTAKLAGGAVTPAKLTLRDADVVLSGSPLYFDFADTTTFTRGSWTLLTGTLPTVASGVASPAANETVVVRSAEAIGDCEATFKVNLPASITSAKAYGFVFKAVDANNFILAQISTSGELQLWKKVAGAWTSYPTHAPITLAPSTSYWIVARVVRNTFEAEFWTTNPAAGDSPTATRSQTFTAGDITSFGAGVRGKVGFRFDAQSGVTIDDAVIRPLGATPRRRDIQVFTSSGTWTKPDGAAKDPKAVTGIHLIAGGSGGASGARRASGTATSGGGGGQGGAYTQVSALTSQLAASAAITVGAGGAGGAAVTTNDTNGNAGNAGGVSIATAIFADGRSVQARTAGAVVPIGGNTGAAAGGQGGVGTWTAGTAGAGVVGAAGGSAALQSGNPTTSGGGGGGVSSAPAGQGGGSGGFDAIHSLVSGTSAAGAVGATAPAGGAVFPGGPVLGMGGGGGGGSHTGNGGNGAAGSNYGGGGGGGGSCLNGFTSGAGGAGAPGVVVIITEWGG